MITAGTEIDPGTFVAIATLTALTVACLLGRLLALWWLDRGD